MEKPKGYPKKKYRYFVFASSDYDFDPSSENFEGSTWAVSEKQAINNIRHNNYGDNTSQYKGDYYWKAIAEN